MAAAVLVVVTAGSLAAPAYAATDQAPVGACPTSFDLLLSINDPRLAGLSGQPSLDGNGDGLTCVHIISDNQHGNGFRVAVVDNRAQDPTGLRP
jgi:hypothetical protein